MWIEDRWTSFTVDFTALLFFFLNKISISPSTPRSSCDTLEYHVTQGLGTLLDTLSLSTPPPPNFCWMCLVVWFYKKKKRFFLMWYFLRYLCVFNWSSVFLFVFSLHLLLSKLLILVFPYFLYSCIVIIFSFFYSVICVLILLLFKFHLLIP